MNEENTLAAVVIGVLAILAVLGVAILIWFGLLVGRPMQKYAEETRSQVYEQSRAYQQGLKIDLADLCRQMAQTDDAQSKAAISETIRLRADRAGVNAPCVN